ncbi:hypothetical protein PMAYCL1PPCAC_32472, partial [Pristionchus mayeri]
YPVHPLFFFVHSTLCSIPIVVLLIATQKCALHPNCRYLISFWCISLLGVLVNIVMLNAQTMNYEKGFIPRGILDPPLRPHFLAIHSMTYASSSCFEMFIAFERILSTRRPHVYHLSRENWTALISLTIFAYSLGSFIGYFIYIAGHHILGVLIYNTIDLSTLVINTIGIRYCKRRYDSLYAKASLNARYQVFEAYEMARAMHPIYFGSFVLKGIGMAIAYVYFLMMSFFDGRLYALMDFGYFAVHAFNCAFSSAFLMYQHKSLRKSILTMVGSKSHFRAVIKIAHSSTTDTTDKYFTMLENS